MVELLQDINEADRSTWVQLVHLLVEDDNPFAAHKYDFFS